MTTTTIAMVGEEGIAYHEFASVFSRVSRIFELSNRSANWKSEKEGHTTNQSTNVQEQINHSAQFVILERLQILEEQLEALRLRLSSCKDFNLPDAFRSFDVQGRAFLDYKDFEAGLNGIGLHFNERSVRLFF